MYLTLACRRDLVMLRASLSSLLQHLRNLPVLILAFDESLSREDLETHFSDWPGEIQFWSREETTKFHAERGEISIAEFCRRDIFGFKFAACARAAETSRTLYADSDVLWFQDSNSLMASCNEQPVYGSTDLGTSVDEPTVEMLSEETKALVLQFPRVCAGFAIYNRPIEPGEELRRVLSRILSTDRIGRLTEQTFIGVMVRSFGALISDDFVPMVRPITARFKQDHIGERTFACHYPGELKTQLWIDYANRRNGRNR